MTSEVYVVVGGKEYVLRDHVMERLAKAEERIRRLEFEIELQQMRHDLNGLTVLICGISGWLVLVCILAAIARIWRR